MNNIDIIENKSIIIDTYPYFIEFWNRVKGLPQY